MPSVPTDMIEMRVLRRRDEAENIISLDLVAADGATLLPTFEPGAHIDVHLGPGLVRQYSLCSDPADAVIYRLGILHEPEGRGGSQAAHREFVEGRTVRIGLPRNTFRLVEDARHSVLMAGGIGVTPLLAMAYRLHALGRSFELHYCTRNLGRTAFMEDVAKASFMQQVFLHHSDGPEVQRFDPSRDMAEPATDVHMYVCGPKGFMDWVTEGARAVGWQVGNIHSEYFTADIDITGETFTVEARRSRKSFVVPSDRSIADVMKEVGIDIPLSCEQGVCGTCLVSVLEGRPDHRDVFQSDEERVANTQITPCCSRSFSSMLVLDI